MITLGDLRTDMDHGGIAETISIHTPVPLRNATWMVVSRRFEENDCLSKQNRHESQKEQLQKGDFKVLNQLPPDPILRFCGCAIHL